MTSTKKGLRPMGMMYSNSAMPVSNHIAERKKRAQDEKHHTRRIANVKADVDNHTPRTFHYLKYNPKKMLKQEEEYERVERENAILLSKLSDIARSSKADKLINAGPGLLLDKQMRPRIDNLEPRAMPSQTTLNSFNRREELVRIMQENQNILSRIEGVQGCYSRRKWEEQNAVDSYLMDQISKFHPDLNISTASAGGVAQRAWRPPSRPISAPPLSPDRSASSSYARPAPRPQSSMGTRAFNPKGVPAMLKKEDSAT